MAGAGVLVRLVGATWKVVNSVKVGDGGGGNGTGEWRGRVEATLEQGLTLQRETAAYLAAVGRSVERSAEALDRLDERVAQHAAEGRAEHAALGRQIETLDRRLA